MILAITFDNLHQVLRKVYDEMMPLCSDLTGVAKVLAGLGALLYVSYRVWQALARAEPIDVFPLLRPFAIGLCIMFFPVIVLGTINSVLSPVVVGCNEILKGQVLNLNDLQTHKDYLEKEALRRNPETAYLADSETFDQRLKELGIWNLPEIAGMYMDKWMYSLKKSIRNGFRYLLELLFQAAALVIDTIRTFFLIVLAILGPIAFAISVWDGFQSTLGQWFTRYISVYLWLPVSDLFSSVLARINSMIVEQDIAKLTDPSYVPDASGGVYIVFLLIGIMGYFTIPTIAGWIVQSGGAGNYGKNVNSAAGNAANKAKTFAAAATGAAVGNIAGRLFGGKSGDDGNEGPGGGSGGQSAQPQGKKYE